MKPPKIAQRSCQNCDKRMIKAQRDVMEWGLVDLFMVIITLGMWVIIRYVWHQIFHPWTCSECGAKV